MSELIRPHVFLVVINTFGEGTQIKKFSEAEHVLNAIAQMKNVEVERVFAVNELGEVLHYDIVFQGKLKLISKGGIK
jgi:hypothetical protein